MKLLSTLAHQPLAIRLSLVTILLLVVGLLDILTGYEYSFSVFYVIPVGLATWSINHRYGVAFAFASAITWFLADRISENTYSNAFIPVWNTGIRLGFFLIITYLLHGLSKALEEARSLSRTDNLTGAVNSRFFYELMQIEIDRYERYERTFTLVYLDLDNFKPVNDNQGHLAGNAVLKAVVSVAKEQLRKTDVVARIGGDEFALLLPETDFDQAQSTLEKLQMALLKCMKENNWPVTFSVGALICNAPPPEPDVLMSRVDTLMYAVKTDSKNGIRFELYFNGA